MSGSISSHLGKAQTSAKHAKPSTFLHSMTATGTGIGPTRSTSGKIEDWQANLRVEEQTVEPFLCNNPPKEKHVFYMFFVCNFIIYFIYIMYIYICTFYHYLSRPPQYDALSCDLPSAQQAAAQLIFFVLSNTCVFFIFYVFYTTCPSTLQHFLDPNGCLDLVIPW